MSKQHIKIKDHLCKRGAIANRLSRMRHFRGHGVHSPYIYIMVRKILLHHNYDASLFDTNSMQKLRGCALTEHRSEEILAVAQHCGYDALEFNSAQNCDMAILTPQCSDDEVLAIVEDARTSGTAVVIIEPYRRKELSDRVLKNHNSTSIDRYDYLLLFNNYLPKQHFRL